MNHGVDSLLTQHASDRLSIRNVQLVERKAPNIVPVSTRQVIHDHHTVSAPYQKMRRIRSDVPRPTGDQNLRHNSPVYGPGSLSHHLLPTTHHQRGASRAL